jgi:drug/metabolite transporter superfamily protein YnfA
VNVASNPRPVGQRRNIAVCLVLFVVTLGFYGWYWAYKTQEEMKQHTGDGLGGVLGLVVWIVVGFISAFVIPSEVGKMYSREGHAPPVTGWTGLWLIPFGIFVIPAIVWFVKVQGALNRHWEMHGAV